MNFSKKTELAIKTAKKAGKLIKKGFYEKFKTLKKKGIHNLVTKYDIASEELIINEIKKYYPTDSILSEEKGAEGSSTSKWIIDPLDGTVNFAHHIPIFCVSIAEVIDEEIILGVIYQPMTDELFVAEKDKGSYLNGKKIKVTETSDIKDSILATGFPYNIDKNPKNCLDKLSFISKKGITTRRIGSAALNLAYVADGRFDGYFETNIAPWDCAAGALLVTEANGKVTDWKNNKLVLKDSISIFASNGKIGKNIINILKDHG